MCCRRPAWGGSTHAGLWIPAFVGHVQESAPLCVRVRDRLRLNLLRVGRKLFLLQVRGICRMKNSLWE